ncbi:Cob(I)yrinic acid a,c-diamide adenosyltransferase [Klebsiella pneumoniae]|nr:Cob(I)yrinic acid a,c-diamide adenosyltransferase [Klebsiella pneumoniae]
MYRIYTRTGDKGTTALYGGSRIEKDHIRVEAYGTVDELISQLGVCYATTRDAGLRESLHHIQQTLFVLGAELASDARGLTRLSQTIGEEEITALERLIDRNMAESGPLKQFVIPGRNLASAQLHVARTLLWSSFFGHADQMVGLCTGGQLGGRAGQRFVLCG